MLTPGNILTEADRIPPGSGFKHDLPISPFDFRDGSGLALTGSGNQRIDVTSGVASVLLPASAAGAVVLAPALPGLYDATPPRDTADRFGDGDFFVLSLLCANSTSGSRTLTAQLRNRRASALSAFVDPANVVATITGTNRVLYEWSFKGKGFLPRDIPSITLTAQNTTGAINIFGGVLTIRNNWVMHNRADR